MRVICRAYCLPLLLVALGMVELACSTSVAAIDEAAAAESGASAAVGEADLLLAEFEWDGVQHRITLSQMESEISELPDYRKDDYDGRAGREEYLQLMAESRLGLERARDLGLDADAEILEKVETYRREIMLDAVEEMEVTGKVNVTDEDVAAYYEAHLEEYMLPEQVRLTCVTVQDPEEAAGLLAEIEAGERTLDEIATAMSAAGKNVGPGGNRNGDTGFFARETWTEVETFVNAAFEMQPGDVTDEVVELDRLGEKYYMVFRQEERNEPRQQTLDEVEKRIRRSVESDTETARQEEWAQQLRELALLVVHEDLIPVLAPEADAEEDTDADEGDGADATEEDEATEADADVEPDAALALAEYSWDDVPHAYTYGELKAHFDGLAVYRQSRYKGAEGALTLLDEQIVEDLKVLEAKKLGHGYSEVDLAKLDDYRDQLMVEALVEQEVDGHVEVTEEDLQAYYEDHLDEYLEDEKARLTCVTFTDADEAASKLEEVVAGLDIAELATTESEMGKNQGPGANSNGDTGLFTRNTYRQAPNFVEQAFTLPVGEMTAAPIEVNLQDDTYFMIFRVEERQPERQQELDEVRSKVERATERINKRARFEEWLEDLVTASKLQVYADRLPEYPEPEGEETSEATADDAETSESDDVEGHDEDPDEHSDEGDAPEDDSDEDESHEDHSDEDDSDE